MVVCNEFLVAELLVVDMEGKEDNVEEYTVEVLVARILRMEVVYILRLLVEYILRPVVELAQVFADKEDMRGRVDKDEEYTVEVVVYILELVVVHMFQLVVERSLRSVVELVYLLVDMEDMEAVYIPVLVVVYTVVFLDMEDMVEVHIVGLVVEYIFQLVVERSLRSVVELVYLLVDMEDMVVVYIVALVVAHTVERWVVVVYIPGFEVVYTQQEVVRQWLDMEDSKVVCMI